MHCLSYDQLVNSVCDFCLSTPPSPLPLYLITPYLSFSRQFRKSRRVKKRTIFPKAFFSFSFSFSQFLFFYRIRCLPTKSCNRYLTINLAKAKSEASICILSVSFLTYAKKSRNSYLTDFKTKSKSSRS